MSPDLTATDLTAAAALDAGVYGTDRGVFPARDVPWTCRCGQHGQASTFTAAMRAWRHHYNAAHRATLTATALNLAVIGHAI